MSKTARDVMTPGDAWPGEELGDFTIGPLAAVSSRQPVGAGDQAASGGGGAVSGGDRPADRHVIGADDWVDAALKTMTELRVRRLPVIDGDRLVGTVSQGDLARSIEHPETWSRLCK